MHRANRVIIWGSMLTVILVAACLTLPFFVLEPDDGGDAGEVITAISLMAAYLILVVGILAVGSNTYGNLALRRADPVLETRANRQYFNVGVSFCILSLGFIFLSVIL